jgi:inosine-uridine nucleoside N-ribohydrolase
MKAKFFLLLFAMAAACSAQKRLVLIDQDGAGPGGTDQMSILALLQAPQVDVLGITMVTGDGWMEEETRHTLRMLELTGHANVPVAKGANHPLVRTEQETRLEESITGKAGWLGAWNQKLAATIPEGEPTIKPVDEDAAHFLIRQVHAHPHDVTIYAAGPLTNIALAVSIDPEFAALTKGIVLMGSSLHPQTTDPEFATDPRHEFNLWFDPEASHIVLHAPWPSIEVTTADVSLKAPLTQAVLDRIAKSNAPAARYITQWSKASSYLWDELTVCAWLDPTIITKRDALYLDVDLGRGPNYGNTLTWTDKNKPATATEKVQAQMDLDREKFEKLFVQLMTK